MPKSQPVAGSPAVLNGEEPLSPIEAICAKADTLFRSACECCRQHERLARMVEISTVDAEQRTTTELVKLCDAALAKAAAAYEKCTARAHPNGDDEAWWHKANALWYASREYLRRNSESERASRHLNPQSATTFGELHMDYELEASALLALQQAVDSYRKSRPDAVDCMPRR
jgi:hypothetical protein